MSAFLSAFFCAEHFLCRNPMLHAPAIQAQNENISKIIAGDAAQGLFKFVVGVVAHLFRGEDSLL